MFLQFSLDWIMKTQKGDLSRMRIDHLILAAALTGALFPECVTAQGPERGDPQGARPVQHPERARNALRPERPSLSSSDQKLLDQIEHLNKAAEHLQRAGMNQDADRMRARARDIARELEDRQAALDPERMAREIRELRSGLDELRAEVRTLREELSRRRTPPVGSGRSPEEFRREMLEWAERYRQDYDDYRHLQAQPEGRARLPGRRRFSDEELDASPADRPIAGPEQERFPSAGQEKPRKDDVEFQLVPVPPPESASDIPPDQEPDSSP